MHEVKDGRPGEGAIRLEGLFAGGLSLVGDGGHQSGIRKRRLWDEVEVGIEGVVGDEIVDRRFHGGPERALNVFASEYYDRLRQVFPAPDEPWQGGGFGENLSIRGLLDEAVRIGDVYRCGSVLLQASQPRSPCWKLNARFGVDQLSRHVQDQRMTGWYARVLQPGRLRAGEAIELIERDEGACTLVEFWDAVTARTPDLDRLEVLARQPTLAGEWQTKLQKRVDYLRRKGA